MTGSSKSVSYRCYNAHERRAGPRPWVCVRPACDEGRPGSHPQPFKCPRCGAKTMRGGPFLDYVEREPTHVALVPEPTHVA